jgi:hypothetical protein
MALCETAPLECLAVIHRLRGGAQCAYVAAEASISRLAAGATTAEQFPENVEIRHHTNAMLFAERLYCGGGKVPDVSGAQTSAPPSAAV